MEKCSQIKTNFVNLNHDALKRLFLYLDYLTLYTLSYTCITMRKTLIDSSLLDRFDLRNIKLKNENNTIYRILNKHKHLKEVVIEFKDINDTHVFQIGKNTMHINLNGCQKITDKSLIHIASTCLNLRRLEIYWIPNVSDKGLKPILENCKGIRHLNLSGCKHVTEKSLSLLHTLKDLEYLDLTRCVGLTDKELDQVGQLEHLSHLNLYALPYLHCSFLKDLKTSNLQFLDLCGNANVNDDLFVGTGMKLTNLKYLNLSWCVLITDRTVEFLASIANGLELLSLHGLVGVTDRSVEALRSNVKPVEHLSTFDLNGCCNVLKRSEEYLRTIFPKLIVFKYHS